MEDQAVDSSDPCHLNFPLVTAVCCLCNSLELIFLCPFISVMKDISTDSC